MHFVTFYRLFIYLLFVDGHLGHFLFRATMNNAALNFFCIFFGVHPNAFLFGIHLTLDYWDMGYVCPT